MPDVPRPERPNPLLVPDPDAVDQLLYDYLRRADRMGWSPYDLVDHDAMRSVARPERLNEAQVGAVKTVLFVEDHLPGYLSEYLRIMTNPDLSDPQQIVSRKVLHFTFRWVGEEDRHAHVLEMYLTRSGLMNREQLEQEMLRERKTAYVFPYDQNNQLTEGFIYLALQEKATHLYYRALARDVDEPLLKAILTRMGADEASHGAFFYDLLLETCRGDLDALSRKISAVATDFKMPVQNNARAEQPVELSPPASGDDASRAQLSPPRRPGGHATRGGESSGKIQPRLVRPDHARPLIVWRLSQKVADPCAPAPLVDRGCR